MSASQQAYISKVHLKGYKSIRDLEIDFKPGLNIIIGPNGSGKTNFLEFLNSMIRRSFRGLNDFKAIIETVIGSEPKLLKMKENDNVSIHIEGKSNSINFLNKSIEVKGKVFINKELKEDVNLHIEEDKTLVIKDLGLFYFHFGLCVFVEHHYPVLSGVAIPTKIIVNSQGNKIKGYSSQIQFGIDYFISNIVNPNHLEEMKNPKDIFEISSDLIKLLQKYTLIEDIRLIKDSLIITHIDTSPTDSETTIDNILIEFSIKNSKRWLKWIELSDGTKRMFHIISKVFYESKPKNCDLILLEEPELGIHPDQLYKLMDFIKEQSKEKQIILTTHSPDVLNTLGKDELDRIVVTRYDEEKGTQMHKLSPQQIKKGQRYMEKVGHLSDYWVHSNLEEYEIEE